MMSELTGCSDHNCIIAKPIGMGTNGGCRCEKEVSRVGEVGRIVVRKLRMQDKNIAALEAKLMALITAVRALPVEEAFDTHSGQPYFMGYGMQAQGEWDDVLSAIQGAMKDE